MLHIILLILKIIGIILAVILGILVLLICIALFVPIRYQVSAECDGTLDGLKAQVKVTWLLRLIGATFSYQNKEMQYKVRIIWKNIITSQQTESEEIYEDNRIDQEEYREEQIQIPHAEAQPAPQVEESHQELRKEPEVHQPKDEEKPKLPERTEEGYQEDDSGDEKKSSIFEKIGQRCRAIKEKIQNIFHKIKCTFANICDKINMLLDRKDTLAAFIEDEVHVGAFNRAKRELFKLLKRLKPKKIKADIHYGFDDPCLTGQVLAGLSILYPIIGGCTNVTPDFEQKVLDGNLYIKGKVSLYYFVIVLWNLVWSKDVRRTYKDVRNFKW